MFENDPKEGGNQAPQPEEPCNENCKEQKAKEEYSKAECRPKTPTIDFSSFVISLAHEGLMFLGEIPHPETGKQTPLFPMAKQTIDIIEMLQTKTKGNLSVAEERLVEQILFDLRTKFVYACKAK